MEAVKRVCPQCGRVLEEDFVSCPYCGRLLGARTQPLPERKKRSKLRWAAGIVLAIILVFATLSVLGYWLRPVARLELVSKDATLVDDGTDVRISVTLKNPTPRDANVEVKFKTSWEYVMSDTETKEIVIPAFQTRTVSATLNGHPGGGQTDYEVTWWVESPE